MGLAVGFAWTDVEIAGRRQAVAFVDGEVRQIDQLLHTQYSEAVDVNDRGWVVGNFTAHDRSERAFLSTNLETAVDLNTLLPEDSGWVITRAAGINELGQVVGLGTFRGISRGFVLSTVHAPVAEDMDVTASGETRIQLDGWDGDVSDALEHELVDGPHHGSAELLDGGVVRYRPARGYTGTDRFTYRVSDGRFESNIGTVTIRVTDQGDPEEPEEPENQTPVASITGPESGDEGTTVTLDASRSSDPDGDGITFSWDLDGDGDFVDGHGRTTELALLDDGPRRVSVRVTDPAAPRARRRRPSSSATPRHGSAVCRHRRRCERATRSS